MSVRALVAIVCATAAVLAGGASAATEAGRNVICPRYNGYFWVELGVHGNEVQAYAYTHGAPISRGGNLQYVWVSPGERDNGEWRTRPTVRIDRACRRIARNPRGTTTSLRTVARLKTGQHYFERWRCTFRGRLLIHTQTTPTGAQYLGIKSEGRRPLDVVATINAQGGSLRVSKRCERDPI